MAWRSLGPLLTKDLALEIKASAEVLSSAEKAFTNKLILSVAFSTKSLLFSFTYTRR